MFKEVFLLPSLALLRRCRSSAADKRVIQLNRLPRSVVAAIGSSSVSSVSDSVVSEELLEAYRERSSSSSEGSTMTMPGTESPSLPRPNYWNASDAIETSAVIEHEHPTCHGYYQSRSERSESSTRSSDQTLAEMGGNYSESPFARQMDAQIPDTPSTPGTLPHQTERSSSGELLSLGFPDELIEEMIRYSRGRYRCRLCEDWAIPGTTITATSLFVARVHIVKLCRAASVELKTRLLELDLEIDKIPGQHDTLYLAYLNDFTLDRLQSRNSQVIPLAGV